MVNQDGVPYLLISNREWFHIGPNLYWVNRLNYVLLLIDLCLIYLALKMLISNG